MTRTTFFGFDTILLAASGGSLFEERNLMTKVRTNNCRHLLVWYLWSF